MDRVHCILLSSMAELSPIEVGTARVPNGKRVYAIGDVHGCVEELDLLLFLIERDLIDNPVESHRLIFIGDYCDRGPDSRGVINRLIALKSKGQPVTFLRGNHEDKLISASTKIDGRTMDNFLRYGGAETLASYGFEKQEQEDVLGNSPDETNFQRFSDLARDHVGPMQLAFLQGLEFSTIEGDYFFAHAGVDPTRDLDSQKEHDLVWIREPFLSWDEPLRKVVIHGHTPVGKPQVLRHRINIDTACVYGDALSAVVLEDDQHRFLKVDAKRKYWTRS